MTSFINPDYPVVHRGVERLEAVVAAVQRLRGRFSGARGMVALLLAAGVSALVVVAEQLISSWTEGHLLTAWIVMWTVIFAALALFADATRGGSAKLVASLEARAAAARQRAADERTWAVAQADPRLMAEIDAARTRAEPVELNTRESVPMWPFGHAPTPQQVYKAF